MVNDSVFAVLLCPKDMKESFASEYNINFLSESSGLHSVVVVVVVVIVVVVVFSMKWNSYLRCEIINIC